MFTLIWFTVLFLALVQYIRTVYSRFSKCEVNTIKPLPVLGNTTPLILRSRHIADEFELLYKTFPEDRFVGRYELMASMTVVRDLDLIKRITVKDFEHFLDRKALVDDTVDPIFGRNLFSLRGQEWKDMRSTLSPAFTSLKMKNMVPFMMEANTCMINSLKKRIAASGNDFIDIDCKDLTTRYATDVIGSCAFGVKVDSHEEEKNDFYVNGSHTATFGLRLVLVYLGYTSFPSLMKKLNVKLFSEQTSHFFKSLVLSSMKERELSNIFRPDMIHLLMEANKGKLTYDEKATEEADTGFATVEESDIGKKTINRVWSDIDLVAQATLFFIAGFETVSSTLSFLLHELAVNPDVQEKLVREIRENDAKTNSKFDYCSIQNLKYLDMVISELLRLWPPVTGLGRICVKNYNMGKPHAKAKNDFILKKGESVVIPVWSMHHDPNYFPEPYKFDPERFSDENKHKIIPFTYQPFGSGPRNCIGSRFALCEVKVMVYQLLQEMEVTVCEKTPIPARLAKDTFNLRIEGGHWIRIKARQ